MRKLRILLLMCIAASVFYSCQKEVSEENGNTPTNPLDSNSVRLKRYIKLDTTLAAGNDTVFTMVYSYDAMGRCTSVIHHYFEHPATPIENNEEQIWLEKLYYNGTDTNFYEARYYDYLTNELFTIETFRFDVQGRVITDSIVEYPLPDNPLVFRYRYQGNIVHSVLEDPLAPSDTFFYSTHHQTLINGNIATEIDSVYDYYPGQPSSLSWLININASNDNHPNPVEKTSKPWPVIFEAEHVMMEDIFYHRTKNNLLTYQEWRDGVAEENYSFQYTYLPNGYPSIARMVSTLPTTEHFKIIYEYY